MMPVPVPTSNTRSVLRKQPAARKAPRYVGLFTHSSRSYFLARTAQNFSSFMAPLSETMMRIPFIIRIVVETARRKVTQQGLTLQTGSASSHDLFGNNIGECQDRDKCW